MLSRSGTSNAPRANQGDPMISSTRRQWLQLAVFSLAAKGLPRTVHAQSAASLKEQLTGIWTLVSARNTSSNGATRDLFGPDPKGILILEAGGRYAQVQVRPERP